MTSPQVNAVEPPDGLGPRGLRLWQAWVTPERPLQPGHLLLIAESARIADRLERLDSILRGEDAEWMTFTADLDGRVVRVVMSSALAEARQQQQTLRALVAEVRQALTPARGGQDAATPADEPKEDPLAPILQLVRDGGAPPTA